jgi:hypothetical protein
LLALDLPRSEASAAFTERSADRTDQTHVDAAALVDQSEAADPLGDMYDALEVLCASRSSVPRVPVVRGDIDSTLSSVIEAIATAGVKW